MNGAEPVRLKRARMKWKASGAEGLGFARPVEYSNIEGRVADRLYLGPDPDGGWSIVQAGRVSRSFPTAAQARKHYKEYLAEGKARRT